MRVVLLAPMPPEQGVLADHVALWCRAVKGAGVEILTPLQGQKPLYTLAAAHRWVAERDWRKVDVVHAELGAGRYTEFFVLAALSALPQRPRLSATVHDPERLMWRPVSAWWMRVNASSWVPSWVSDLLGAVLAPHTWWCERRLARRLDGVVVHTGLGAQRLARRLGVPVDTLSVIPHGVPSWPVRPFPDEGPVRLLYLGSLRPQGGLDDLLDALGRLRRQSPDLAAALHLTLAGSHAEEMTPAAARSFLAHLQGRVESLGLGDQVSWVLDGDPRDMPDLLSRHHVLVQPDRARHPLARSGRWCGASGAVALALACGRGVLASDARAHVEELGHGNGRTYPAGDVGALSACLAELARDPSVLIAWGQAARALAEPRAWTHIGPAFGAHFHALRAGCTSTRSAA